MLEKFAAMQMLDVHFPTTDDRELVFCRYTQPEREHKMLLAQLGWELPPQSPPKISAKGAASWPGRHQARKGERRGENRMIRSENASPFARGALVE